MQLFESDTENIPGSVGVKHGASVLWACVDLHILLVFNAGVATRKVTPALPNYREQWRTLINKSSLCVCDECCTAHSDSFLSFVLYSVPNLDLTFQSMKCFSYFCSKQKWSVFVCVCVSFSSLTVCMSKLAHYLQQWWCWYNLSPWKGPIIPDYKSYQQSGLDIWVIQLNPLHSDCTLLRFTSSRVSCSDPLGSVQFKLILVQIIFTWNL